MTLHKLIPVALLGLALLAPPAARAACPDGCATVSSVVNAAGVPAALSSAAGRLPFRGDGLAPGGNAAIKALAVEIKRLPANASVTLRVSADSALVGPAAGLQAAARQRALQQALQKEGVKPAQVTLEAGQ